MGIKISGGVKVPQGQFAVKPPPPPAGPRAFGWGAGSYGQHGQNDTVSRSSPTQIGELYNWDSITAGVGTTFLINTTGELWSWGRGSTGRTGHGDTITRSSPVQVGVLTNWASIGTGNSHTLGVKTDGTLWAWGTGTDGQLGRGNTTTYSSPVQIGNLNTWASVDGGNSFSMAVKTDGTLWAWGSNSTGRLGILTATNIKTSSPVQVAGTDWLKVSAGSSHCIALKTDGTMWGWGNAGEGRLARDPGDDLSSPVQIGSDTNWSDVTASISEHSHAVRTDGTLWSWGTGVLFRLGLGNNTTNYSSPVQVGSLTDWASVVGGQNHTNAIKTDGTLWAWGSNSGGRLGDGTTTNRNSPVQIGSDIDWTSAQACNSHSVGIRTFP